MKVIEVPVYPRKDQHKPLCQCCLVHWLSATYVIQRKCQPELLNMRDDRIPSNNIEVLQDTLLCVMSSRSTFQRLTVQKQHWMSKPESGEGWGQRKPKKSL